MVNDELEAGNRRSWKIQNGTCSHSEAASISEYSTKSDPWIDSEEHDLPPLPTSPPRNRVPFPRPAHFPIRFSGPVSQNRSSARHSRSVTTPDDIYELYGDHSWPASASTAVAPSIHRRSTILPLNSTSPTSPKQPEPQNGRIAWLHALTAFLVVFTVQGLSSIFGLFQAYYTRTLLASTSPGTIAWIGSTQAGLIFGLGIPVGRLVDAGFFHTVFRSGSVLMALGTLLTAQADDWFGLWLCQGLITGLGMGCVFCSGVVVLMGWFDERKMGVAMGVAAAGACVGAVVYAEIVKEMLVRQGFVATTRILACLVVVLLIPANVIFRPRFTGFDKLDRNRPERREQDVGWKMFAERSYVLAMAGMFFAFLGLYFGFVFIVSYGSEVLRLSDNASVDLLIYLSIANLPGRFVPALISDRCIGPLNTIVPATLLSTAVLWLWAASNVTHGSLIVIACFYGFVSAGLQVLYAPTVYVFCNKADSDGRQKLGAQAGGIFSAIGLGSLIGTPIGGALIRYRQNRHMDQPYLGAQIFAASTMLVGGLLLLASRWAKAGWKSARL